MKRLSLGLLTLICAYACTGPDDDERPDERNPEWGVDQVYQGGQLIFAEGGAGGAQAELSDVGRCLSEARRQCIEFQLDVTDAVGLARAEEICRLQGTGVGGAGGGSSRSSWEAGVSCSRQDAVSQCANPFLGVVTIHYEGTVLSVEEQQAFCSDSTVDFEVL